MGKSGKARSNLTVSSIKINQPVKQQKLTFGNSSLSQGAEPLFESETCSSNEAETVSQHDFAQGGPAKRTRLNPTKRRNESDSEIEINESIKQSLLKNEQRWIFVSNTELYAITATIDLWPDNFNYIQGSSIEENKTIDLSIYSQSVRCRLLFRGPKKYVNEIYRKYDEQLRSGRNPDQLHVTYIKADRKQKFCDDINFLSKKMPSNSQTSALKLGATPTVKTITKSSKAMTVPLPEELTPEVFLF